MDRIPVFLLVAVLLGLTATGQASLCRWALKFTTGSTMDAATNSTIRLDIGLPIGGQYTIADLNSKNRIQDPSYLPFRVNGVDYFDFQGPCSPLICNISLETSATGTHPAWEIASVAANVTFINVWPVKQYSTVVIEDWLINARPLYKSRMNVNLCTGSHTYN